MRKLRFRSLSHCLKSHSRRPRRRLDLSHHSRSVNRRLPLGLHTAVTLARFQTQRPGPFQTNWVRITSTLLQTRDLEPRGEKRLAHSGNVSLGQDEPEPRTRLLRAIHLLTELIPLPSPRARARVSPGIVAGTSTCPSPPRRSPHHVDALWLLGKAVGVAAGRGPEVDGHHHEKRLLLRDIRVRVVLQVHRVR